MDHAGYRSLVDLLQGEDPHQARKLQAPLAQPNHNCRIAPAAAAVVQ